MRLHRGDALLHQRRFHTAASGQGGGEWLLCKALDRATKKEDARLHIDDEGIVSIPEVYQGTASAVIDGTFPDWKRVCKPVFDKLDGDDRAFASYNARYIADFTKVCARLGRSSAYVRVLSQSDEAPSLVLFDEERAAFAILMPVRGQTDTRPAFMTTVLAGVVVPDEPAEDPFAEAA